MIKEFKLPNLGENITAAEVTKVLVKAGDKLEKEQSVIEISSDKATLEVPSNVSGIIKEINVKEGDTVKEGQVVLTLETEEQAEILPPAQPEKKPEEAHPLVPSQEVKEEREKT